MRSSFVLLLLAVSACSSPTEGNGWVFGDPLPVQGIAAMGSGGATTVTPGAGKITVAGTYTFPFLCPLAFSFESRQSGTTIVLRISAVPTQDIWLDMVQDWSYQATIDPLPPGTYTVLVQSDDISAPRGGWSTVATETVVVP